MHVAKDGSDDDSSDVSDDVSDKYEEQETEKRNRELFSYLSFEVVYPSTNCFNVLGVDFDDMKLIIRKMKKGERSTNTKWKIHLMMRPNKKVKVQNVKSELDASKWADHKLSKKRDKLKAKREWANITEFTYITFSLRMFRSSIDNLLLQTLYAHDSQTDICYFVSLQIF